MVEQFPIIQNGVRFLAAATKLTIFQSIHNISVHSDIYTTTNNIDGFLQTNIFEYMCECFPKKSSSFLFGQVCQESYVKYLDQLYKLENEL
jgi:hypothetical protein